MVSSTSPTFGYNNFYIFQSHFLLSFVTGPQLGCICNPLLVQLFGCQINVAVNSWQPDSLYLSAARKRRCVIALIKFIKEWIKHCTQTLLRDFGVCEACALIRYHMYIQVKVYLFKNVCIYVCNRKWMHFELFVKPLCLVNEFLMGKWWKHNSLCISFEWILYSATPTPPIPPPPLLWHTVITQTFARLA